MSRALELSVEEERGPGQVKLGNGDQARVSCHPRVVKELDWAFSSQRLVEAVSAQRRGQKDCIEQRTADRLHLCACAQMCLGLCGYMCIPCAS